MYLHRDHLGSIIAITNSDGEVIEKTHYGAWGEVAKYWDTKGNDTLGYTSMLGRGYTGHEHFNSVSLIHMNGRMYDAKLRRFLSPDNFIQDPFNTQSFNRYGYVWNNPLKYNDPSGEELITAIIIGIIVGASIDYGLQVISNYAAGYKGADAWFNKVDFFDVAISGLVSGLTAGFGSALDAGIKIGKFGTFLLKNKKLIKAGEIFVTSVIDITGEGFQPVTGKQFGQRIATAAAVWGATEVLGEVLKKAPQVDGVESKVEGAVRKAKTEAAQDGVDPIGEALAKESSENLPANFYPPSNGALGEWTTETLQPGDNIHRFGDIEGRYFAPEGTPLLQRALPPNANLDIENSFIVIRSFSIQSSIIAPAFGKVGGGKQYFSRFLNARELIEGGYIKVK